VAAALTNTHGTNAYFRHGRILLSQRREAACGVSDAFSIAQQAHANITKNQIVI
jgi:hypothetical protein